MTKMKKGKYIIGLGDSFKMKNPTNQYYSGLPHPDKWYVVDGDTRIVVGCYDTRELAINLALFLDKADQLKLANEMDKLLRGE